MVADEDRALLRWCVKEEEPAPGTPNRFADDANGFVVFTPLLVPLAEELVIDNCLIVGFLGVNVEDMATVEELAC